MYDFQIISELNVFHVILPSREIYLGWCWGGPVHFKRIGVCCRRGKPWAVRPQNQRLGYYSPPLAQSPVLVIQRLVVQHQPQMLGPRSERPCNLLLQLTHRVLGA